jgi:hypothetical protein
MKTSGCVATGLLIAVLCLPSAGWARQSQAAAPDVLESSDVFWVPTMDQALEMAAATGKPIFSMGYSLVPDGTTYTQKAETCPKSVF